MRGYAEELTELKIEAVDFFEESAHKAERGNETYTNCVQLKMPVAEGISLQP